jgi:mRNA-degrading endonuclease toxin of MazEF toxin-antitoxin module
VTVQRGQIWLVTLDPAVGNEQRGTLACLVASGDRFNGLPIAQAIVVPLTTRERGFPQPAAGDATPAGTSRCCARYSGSPRRRASTSPG